MRRWLPELSCVAAVVLAVAILPAAAAAATRPDTHTHPRVGPQPTATPRALGAHAQGTVTTSYNWSGYDDSTDGPFATVTATWVQPRVHTTGATFSDAAFWVGLDGDGIGPTALPPIPSSRSAPKATAKAWPATTPGMRCTRSTR